MHQTVSKGVQLPPHLAAAAVVQVQQLVGVFLEPADLNGVMGPHHKHLALGFQGVDLLHEGVVPHLLGEQRRQEQRLVAVEVVVQVHHPLAGQGFAEALLPGGDDDGLGKAFLLRPVQRDGAGAAAVQVAVLADAHRHGHQRQAGRRPHGVQEVEVGLALFKVGGFAGFQAGGHRHHPLSAVVEGVGVKGHRLGDIPQHEVQSEQAAPLDGGHQAEVPRVPAIPQIDAGRPPRLVGHIVHPVEGAGADAGHRGEVDVLFHQRVQGAGRIQAAQRTTLQKQGGALRHCEVFHSKCLL